MTRKRSNSVAGAKSQALQIQARIENRKPHNVIQDKRADGGGHVYPATVKHGPEAPAQSCNILRQSTNVPSHSTIDYLLSAAYTSPIGVVSTADKKVWAADGDSTVKVLDVDPSSPTYLQILASVNTAGLSSVSACTGGLTGIRTDRERAEVRRELACRPRNRRERSKTAVCEVSLTSSSFQCVGKVQEAGRSVRPPGLFMCVAGGLLD
jgi:hypothetical protein